MKREAPGSFVQRVVFQVLMALGCEAVKIGLV